MRRQNRPREATGAVSPKALRWMELITLLLERRVPATRDEIFAEVAAYGLGQRMAASDRVVVVRTARESARRKFERDKDELRELGLAIETVRVSGGANTPAQVGYALRPGSDRPCRVLVSGARPAAGPLEPDVWAITEADLRVIDGCLARLVALRHHQLHAAAISAQRSLNVVGTEPEPDAGGRMQLMPQEQLAVQVALVADPDGVRLLGRLGR